MTPKMFIETPRLLLREWIPSDYGPYITLNADAEVMEFFPSVKTPEETMQQIQRLEANIAKDGYGFFAVERKDNGQFIGFTGLSHPGFKADFTPCMEVGWRLSRENWGHGFATEAAIASLDYGFDILGCDVIYAFTAEQNIRSERVMQKAGMTRQGYFDHPAIEDGNWLKRHVLYGKVKSHPDSRD